MPELNVNYGLAIKVETTPGTWAAPTMATDALRLAGEPEVSVGYVYPGGREGAAVGGYGIPPSAKPLGRWCRVTFEHELVGSGTATTPPRWGRLLQTFMTETVGASDVSYQPSAAQKKTLSVLVQYANKEFQIRGAVPEELRLVGSPNDGRVLVRATLAGILNAAPTEKALDAQTFGAQGSTPTPFAGAFTVGGTTMIYQEFELDFGITAVPWRTDRNQSDILLEGVVVQVNPRITFPPEVVALSTHDPFARQAAPTTALAFSQRLGTSAGNRYLITGDYVEYDPSEPLPLRSNNGLVYYSPLVLRFARPASGIWFKIAHD